MILTAALGGMVSYTAQGAPKRPQSARSGGTSRGAARSGSTARSGGTARTGGTARANRTAAATSAGFDPSELEEDMESLREEITSLKSSVAQCAKKADIPAAQDLSKYALKTEIPSAANLEGYAKAADLEPYAKKAEIPAAQDLSGYVKKAEIPASADLSQYAKAADLAAYAKKADIPASADLSKYALKTEIPAVSAAQDLSKYALKADFTVESKELKNLKWDDAAVRSSSGYMHRIGKFVNFNIKVGINVTRKSTSYKITGFDIPKVSGAQDLPLSVMIECNDANSAHASNLAVMAYLYTDNRILVADFSKTLDVGYSCGLSLSGSYMAE
ncbi:MAG: hypothetical protein LBT92_00585 [Rickettsiales bacterium]|jgi:hypothetical protein|nr:hypothetical protein [Rickettsiales bacterium]